MRRRSEKYVVEDSKYVHWIGLYLNFHLNWVLGPFVPGRLQNLQTSEDSFAHVITPFTIYWLVNFKVRSSALPRLFLPRALTGLLWLMLAWLAL